MKINKISFNAIGNSSQGSYRIPFLWIKSYLNGKFNCVENEINSSIDIYFCKAGQGIAKAIKNKIPNAKIVLFKPHLEISTNIDYRKPIKTFRSLLSLIFELVIRKKYNKHLEDIKASYILIADSRKFELSYKVSTNKIIYYFKLLEKIDNKNIKSKSSLKNKDKIVFLYHGGIKHYNESFPEIYQILKFISQTKKVEFVCMSNLSDIKRKIILNNVESFYYEYEFDTLIKFLKLADIGYVPNFLRARLPLIKKLHDYINFLFYQLDLYSISEKNSSNAGRAYLYAQFGIPFIAHPTREIVSDFSKVKNIFLSNNVKESLWIVNQFLNNESYYENISNELLKISNDFNLEKETNNFMKFISEI